MTACRHFFSAFHAIHVLLALQVLMTAGASAQTSNESGNLTPDSAEACLICHNMPPVNNIVNTSHGNSENPAAPFTQQGCGSCHGISTGHAMDMLAPDIVFGVESRNYPVSESDLQNQVCLTCHEDQDKALREAGIHRGAALSCSACHSIHQ